MDALKQVHQKLLQVTYVGYPIAPPLLSSADAISIDADPNIPTRRMTTRPTSANLSTILVAQSARRSSCSPKLHLPQKPKLPLLLPQLRNPSRRHSTMPLAELLLLGPSSSLKPSLELARIPSPAHWRSMLLRLSRLARPDWPRMPRSRAGSWQAGTRP